MQIPYLKRSILFLLFMVAMPWIGGVQKATAFDLAVGHQTGQAYSLGIAVSSLVKVKLLPTTDIDLEPVITANDQESLDMLLGGDVAFAVVPIDNSRPPESPDIRALATLGRTGNLTTTLLVRREVADTLVSTILETILNNVAFLSTVDQQAAGLTADAAIFGLAVPLHDGAKLFFMENWASSDDAASGTVTAAEEAEVRERTVAATAAVVPPDPNDRTDEPDDARNFVIYFGFDDDVLDSAAQATLREAAAFAATLEGPAMIIAAYTDAVGDADYNYLLAERRAETVMQGLDALNVRYSRIDLSLFGERSPWAVTLDGVNEASNRRVELFIEEPVGEVELLPVAAE